MIKLKHQSNYLSIEKFDDVDLPDFTVLTGLNGSGKTHLLQAIAQKKVIIESLENENPVYFDYKTFYLENEAPYNAQQVANERESAWQYYEANIKQHIFNTRNGKLGDSYEEIKSICLNKNKKIWYLKKEDFENQDLLQKYKSFKKEISNLFEVNHNFYNNEQAKQIYIALKKYEYSFDEIDKENFNECYKPFSLKNNFLPNNLSKVIIDYYYKYRQNQVNEFQAKTYGKSYHYLSEDEFTKAHGEKPWELINSILKVSSNLGFEITSPEGGDFLQNYQLKLIDKSNPAVNFDFSNLSSGEKVLMALVASIYKASSDKFFPKILLLDEIDASLHPSMVNNLLSVINDVFVKNQVKVILVTHSPTTVALTSEKSVFVMNKKGDKRIEKKQKEEALKILTEGYASLSIEESSLSISYNISKTNLPIVLVEGITDKIILEESWKKLNDSSNLNEMPFYIQDCFSADFLRNMITSEDPDCIVNLHSQTLFIAIFDFDEKGYNCWNQIKNSDLIQDDPKIGLTKKSKNSKLCSFLLPVPDNEDIKKQVIKNNDKATYKNESLLQIEHYFYGLELTKDNFIKEDVKGGGQIVTFCGDKKSFSKKIVDLEKHCFDNIDLVIKQISNIIATTSKT